MNDLVSVCINTYNRIDSLRLTLNSIISQTYKNIEIIIVDDASSDGTKEILEKEVLHIDKRIRYIRHEYNKGLSKARNTAINFASGKYFTFCDDDDEFTPKFIENMVYLLNANDKHTCAVCGVDYSGKLKDIMYKGHTPPVGSQFYFLEDIKAVNGYNENIKSGVDHDLWLRLSSLSNIKIVSTIQKLTIPNKNLSDERMTLNEQKRISGINDSLQIWKEMISKYYSLEFYEYFKKNYYYFMYRKFIIIKIKNKDYKNIIKYLFLINKYFLLKDIKRYFYKIFLKKESSSLFFEFKE